MICHFWDAPEDRYNIFLVFIFVTADQTPTPTRLIRNCEEVGLFDDLQHVNPFEETFRRAISQTGSSLGPLTLTGDETLHTPHIQFNLASAKEMNDVDNQNNGITNNTKLSDKCDRTENHADVLMYLSKSNNNNTTVDESLSTNHECSDGPLKEETSKTVDESQASTATTSATVPATEATTVTRASVIYVPQVASVVQPASGVIYEIAPKKYKPILPMSSQNQSPQIVPQIIMMNTNTSSSTSTTIENHKRNDVNGQILPKLYPKADREIAPNNTRSLVKAKLKEALLKIKNSNADTINNQSNQLHIHLHANSDPSALPPSHTAIRRTHNNKGNDERDTVATNIKEKLSNDKSKKQLANDRVYEKNRAAAAAKRYRLKFKNEHNNLKRKNSQLEADNDRLRSELRAVKTILLAHQDCSVTRAMAMGN